MLDEWWLRKTLDSSSGGDFLRRQLFNTCMEMNGAVVVNDSVCLQIILFDA